MGLRADPLLSDCGGPVPCDWENSVNVSDGAGNRVWLDLWAVAGSHFRGSGFHAHTEEHTDPFCSSGACKGEAPGHYGLTTHGWLTLAKGLMLRSCQLT